MRNLRVRSDQIQSNINYEKKNRMKERCRGCWGFGQEVFIKINI